MKLIDNLIILLLITGAFVGGLYLAGLYWRRLIHQWQYIAKIMAAQNGVGYVAQPDEEREPLIGEEFMEHLVKHKRATQAIRTPQTKR